MSLKPHPCIDGFEVIDEETGRPLAYRPTRLSASGCAWSNPSDPSVPIVTAYNISAPVPSDDRFESTRDLDQYQDPFEVTT